jgi:cytochrome P450
MRMLPTMLQPVFVWLLPQKWRLRSSTKELESFVIPQVNKYREDMESEGPVQHTMIGWMVAEARQDIEKDPYFLTQLLAALSAGGSYSSANFIVSTLLDLIAHPHFLDEIREEIALKHLQVNGNWDYQAFNSLPKLDSAFKETSRLAPGSLTTYSRVMLRDHTLSNGITLKKGQFICISSYCLSKDPSVYPTPDEYDALRQFNANFEGHLAHPFKDLENQEFRWGAGRWACAGRYLAALVAKIILVKMLDEYDFQFIDGTRPKNTFLYEFVFVDPAVKVMMRRRDCSHGIQYADFTNS